MLSLQQFVSWMRALQEENCMQHCLEGTRCHLQLLPGTVQITPEENWKKKTTTTAEIDNH